MKLSICMMVKDEAKSLDRCLNSMTPLLKEIDSELIIVDTGSMDNTVEIAKKYTQNIYLHPWFNDFSGMRNITINYGKGEWILIIDADEEIQDCNNIIGFLNSEDRDKYNAIALTVKNFTNENKLDLFVLTPSPRLFKNDGYFHYEGRVHNEPKYNGFVKFIDVYFSHYGYITTDKELVEKKFKRTGDLLKDELEKNPENIYYRFQLSVTYESHGDNEKALEEVKKAFSLMKNKKLNPYDHIYLYLQMAQNLITNKMFEEAKKICIEGIEVEKENLDLYFYLAMAETMIGNIDKAIEAHLNYFYYVNNFDNLAIRNNGYINIHTIGFKEDSYYNIAVLYFKKENYKEAIEYIDYIKSSNYIEKAIELVIQLCIAVKDYERLAEYYYTKVLECNERILNSFLLSLEENVNGLEKAIKLKILDKFSNKDDQYSLLNKIRMYYLEDSKEFYNELNNAKNSLDFIKLPDFYGDIIYFSLQLNVNIADLFQNLSDTNITRYLTYLAERYSDLNIVITNYLNIFSSSNSFSDIKANKILGRSILILESKEPGPHYKEFFIEYIKNGVEYIRKLYREEIIENELINEVKNDEEIFLVYMYHALKHKCVSESSYIKYLRKSLQVYPVMNKGIEELLNELKQENSPVNKELETYKIKLKDMINGLINKGNLEEAKELINEYEIIVKDDVDIFSMKAIVAIIEKEFDDAELILKDGLAIQSDNEELLLNMSYLMDNNKNYVKSLEYFCRAKLLNPQSNSKVQDIISNLLPSENDKLKVIHGTMEIANQMHIMTQGLKNIGASAKTLNYYPNYIGYKSDITLNLNSFADNNIANRETKDLASRLISENDVFHFHFGTSLTLDHTDLPLLKELGKKVVMQHWGTDVRMLTKAIKNSPYVKVKQLDESIIKKQLLFLSSYIKHCIVSDYELYEYVKEYYSNIHIIPQCIDLKRFDVQNNNNEKLLIVHAPTNREVKGTDYIIKAIEHLKLYYDFEFKLIENMNYEAAMQLYRKADIVIDQILIGSYGLVSIENMALGKPVICFINEFMKEKYPKELPIISAGVENIKEKIKFLITNKDSLKEIGISGRKYVEKHHDVNLLSSKILDIYKMI